MKLPVILTLVLSAFGLIAFAADPTPAAPVSFAGAWGRSDAQEHVQLITDDYWVQTTYDREQRRFGRTLGGTYQLRGDVATGRFEFDSGEPDRVGSTFEVRIASDGQTLTITYDENTKETWKRLDDGRGPLAGVWRITERKVGDAMRPMPLQARRTLKILTAQRFQWIAFNVQNGEFSGTGGGTYTLKDGKYVETIEFFSRDASRVGAQLSFDAEVSGDRWVHRGSSSKGDPIYEIWSRFKE